MISRLKGTLVTFEPDRIEVETAGGITYEVSIPRTVAGRLPPRGSDVEIRTLQVVRDDSVALYGFLEAEERELFIRLLGATGVGAKLAVALLSTYSAPRLARALAEKDVAALKQVSGVGQKTAERIVVELADKVQDLAVAASAAEGGGTEAARDAVAALVRLGYSFSAADETVHEVMKDGSGEPASSEELIRRALARR